MANALIEARNLCFSYPEGEEQGIFDVNFKINKGEVVLLTGNSGSGKSTLLKCINGLIPALYEGDLKGDVLIDGISTKALGMAKLSHKMGTVFQNPRSQFFTDDSTAEMVFAMENYGVERGEMRKRLSSLCKEFDVENIMGRKISTLSSGERQLLALASAKTLNQDIFLFDEPSANLDYGNCMRLSRIIAKMKKNGMCVIVADHRFYYLNGIVDRVFLMDHGRINIFESEEEFRKCPYDTRNISLFDMKIERGAKRKAGEIKLKAEGVGYKNILKNISFELRKGEVCALVGNNGCGKTTLAKLLCRSVKPSTGKLWSEETPLYIMQDADYQLFGISVENELMIAERKLEKKRVDEALLSLNISELREKHPFDLSGGQKQRLQIGMALVSDKELMIFDEPTSGLDLYSMNRVSNEIRELSKRAAVLAISHDYEFIRKVADRIIYIKDSEIKADFVLDDEGIERLNQVFLKMERDFIKGEG